LNHPGSGTIDLWFTTSVGAGAGAVLAIGFCFGYPIDSMSLNLLSSSFLLPVSLASDAVSCMSCSSDSSWYFDCFSLM